MLDTSFRTMNRGLSSEYQVQNFTFSLYLTCDESMTPYILLERTKNEEFFEFGPMFCSELPYSTSLTAYVESFRQCIIGHYFPSLAKYDMSQFIFHRTILTSNSSDDPIEITESANSVNMEVWMSTLASNIVDKMIRDRRKIEGRNRQVQLQQEGMLFYFCAFFSSSSSVYLM